MLREMIALQSLHKFTAIVEEDSYPPRPSVPKSSEKISCTFLMYCRDQSGSKTRFENRKTDRFSTSSFPK